MNGGSWFLEFDLNKIVVDVYASLRNVDEHKYLYHGLPSEEGTVDQSVRDISQEDSEEYRS